VNAFTLKITDFKILDSLSHKNDRMLVLDNLCTGWAKKPDLFER